MKRVTDKKKNKKSTKKIVILLGIIIAIIAFIVVSNTIHIKSIEISINIETEETSSKDSEKKSLLTENEIKSASGLAVGNNLFTKKKKDIIESIKANNPYVKDVEIKRSLNGKVKINITEREVSYLINYAGTYIYIDNEGNILELNSETKNVPILLGTTTDFTSLAVGDSQNKVARLNDKDLDKLTMSNNIMDKCKNNDVDNLVSSIDITDSKNYTLRLESESKTVYLGNCKDLNTRILYMKKIVEQESGHAGEIFANVDLNKSYVYFREST